MDPQIEELKELVRRNIKLSEDTNELVHSMRKQAQWSMVFRALWWLTILGVTGALYYYFLWPYIEQIQGIYRAVNAGGAEAQNFFTNFFQR